MLRVVLLVALVLVAVLAATGLVLTWAYRPAPDGPEVVRTVHRLASVLLLPTSWVLVFALVQARWGRGGASGVGRWVVPALIVVAVPLAAFTGFLLPWERVFYATAVVVPDVRGMGPGFDAAVSAVSFGGAPVTRPTFQRYVLAHFFLGAAVTALVLIVAKGAVRGGGRTRRGTGSPPPGRTAGPPPRTTA